MKVSSIYALAFGTLLVTSQPVSSADKNNNANVPKNVPQSSTLSPSSNVHMTKGECEGLAGKVKEASNCAGTSQTCITIDQDGVLHSTCLTVEKN